MKTTPLKIMHVNYSMNIGGIEAFIMNVIRKTNTQPENIIVLTYSSKEFDYERELQQRGIKIVRIADPHHTSTFKHFRELRQVIKQEKVDVVHAHTYFDSAFVVAAAYFCGVRTRISHSHTAMAHLEKRLIKKLKWTFARILLMLFATDRLACSEVAGKALFGIQKFTIIPNGINLAVFSYNTASRSLVRKEMNVSDETFIIGHVGRLDTPKNHSFLVDIFKSYKDQHINSKLVLVGSGRLRETLEVKIESLNLSDDVIFLGDRDDIANVLNSFDYFVFPSIYEGLPVSLIEAQANGLPIIVSDVVSREIEASDNMRFVSLEESADTWAAQINTGRHLDQTDRDERLKKYDIQATLNILNEIYHRKKAHS